MSSRRASPAGLSSRAGRLLMVMVLGVIFLLVPPAVSLERALTYPGSASVADRAVGWVRDNGGGQLVDTVENWWFSHHGPPSTGRPTDHLTAGLSFGSAPKITQSTRLADSLPHVRLLPGAGPAEGVWHPLRMNTAGRIVLWSTMLRPDPAHPTVVAAVAMMPRTTTALHLGGGTREPVVGHFPASRSRVPAEAAGSLVAAFNAGWKSQDSGGGWYAGGEAVVPLRDGMASLVIDTSGRPSVMAWDSRAVPPGQVVPTGVAAVRQNLHLIVEGGRPSSGMDANAHGRWGSSHNQFQFTARSGIGTDAHGDLLYVAGQNLTLWTLADAMSRAGVVAGMELDIHSNMVAFNSFASAADARLHRGQSLLSSMKAPPNRYLVPDQRDFFYLTER